jgi:hypothetical protein
VTGTVDDVEREASGKAADTSSTGEAPQATPRTSPRRVAVHLFLALVALYGLSAGGHTYSSDEEGMLLSTRQMVEEHTPVLVVTEDNAGLIPAVPGADGSPVGVSGMAQIAAATPLLGIGTLVGATVAPAYADYTERLFVGFLNSGVTALGVIVFFLLCLELGASMRRALLLALVYGVGTYVWPHAKTMFSEPIAALLVLAAVLEAVRFRTRASLRHAAYAGAFLGAGLMGRTSNGLFIPMVCAYLAGVALTRTPRIKTLALTGVAVAAGAAVPVALFLVSNVWRFGSPFDLGYQAVPLDYPVLEGLYGLFLSPGKSLFLYAPVALVGIAAAVWPPRARRAEAALFLALGFGNALFFARFPYWHGDHTWGPRYLLMGLPFFILPAAWVVHDARWRRAVVITGAVGLASALLGTVMYFNQYFAVAEAALGSGMDAEGAIYWKSMHFDPEWSPIIGHARLLDDVVRDSVDLLSGEPPHEPFQGSTGHRYGWYFGPPQLDSWVYWNLIVGGPKRLFLLVPLLLLAGVLGVRGLVRDVRASGP